ncbi:MAG: hypothetical protein ABSC48_11155 [Terracidiphilus sp.]|jgi:hypothetical protein
MSQAHTFIVAGSGEADSYQRELFEAKARATVRYADPAAWITATAVARALTGAQELLAQWRHEIGVIAISDQGPGGSMAQVQADATTGFSSPLHYAASSPGTLVGVSAIAFGLRGPTMNLTMDPRDGLPEALILCANWLKRKAARLMVVTTCRVGTSGAMKSRALLLTLPELLESGAPLTEPELAWLAASDPANGAGA